MARYTLMATALVALMFAAQGAVRGHAAAAAIMPVQLIPAPNQEDSGESDEHESDSAADDEEQEEGSSRGEDMQDGILRLPRTGDDEAVKVPPAERLPPSPRDHRRRE